MSYSKSFIFPQSTQLVACAQCGKVVKNTITILWENQHFFRQINILTKEVTKELISRKNLSVIAFYSTFPHCVVCWKINVFTKFLQIEKKFNSFLIFTNFFPRSLEARRCDTTYLATFYREKQQLAFRRKKSSTVYCTYINDEHD